MPRRWPQDWFTLEVMLRFVACPSKLGFWSDFKNIVDVVAIVPYYVTFISTPHTVWHGITYTTTLAAGGITSSPFCRTTSRSSTFCRRWVAPVPPSCDWLFRRAQSVNKGTKLNLAASKECSKQQNWTKLNWNVILVALHGLYNANKVNWSATCQCSSALISG